MQSHLQCTAGTTSRSSQFGAMAFLLGLLALCAAWVRPAASPAESQGHPWLGLEPAGTASSAPERVAEDANTTGIPTTGIPRTGIPTTGIPLLAAARDADGGGRMTSQRDGEHDFAEAEVSESEADEEIAHASTLSRPVCFGSAGEAQALRPRDPIVELCCVRVAPTRAPPATARTDD